MCMLMYMHFAVPCTYTLPSRRCPFPKTQQLEMFGAPWFSHKFVRLVFWEWGVVKGTGCWGTISFSLSLSIYIYIYDP